MAQIKSHEDFFTFRDIARRIHQEKRLQVMPLRLPSMRRIQAYQLVELAFGASK